MACLDFCWKTPRFSILISPSKLSCLRIYIKHSSECFIAISKTSKFVKNTPLRRKRKSCTVACLDFWWKTPRFSILISPSKISCLRIYIKHSSECFIAISKTSKFVKNTPLRVVFSTFFSVFDMWWNTVSRVWYITSFLLCVCFTTFQSVNWFVSKTRLTFSTNEKQNQ